MANQEVKIKFSADASQYNSAIRSMVGFNNQFSSALGKIGGIVSGGAIGMWAKGGMDWAGGIADFAAKTRMSAETAQVFDQAARDVGQTVEVISGPFRKFVQLMEQARNGSKEATASLAKVGVTTDQIRKQRFDEAFLQTAKALGEGDVSAQQMASSIEVLGKQGLDLLNVFKALEGKKPLLSDGSIESLNRLGDALDNFILKLKASGGMIINAIAHPLDSLRYGPANLPDYNQKPNNQAAADQALADAEAADLAQKTQDKQDKLRSQIYAQQEENKYNNLSKSGKREFLSKQIKDLTGASQEEGQDPTVALEMQLAVERMRAKLSGLGNDKLGQSRLEGDSMRRIGLYVGQGGANPVLTKLDKLIQGNTEIRRAIREAL